MSILTRIIAVVFLCASALTALCQPVTYHASYTNLNRAIPDGNLLGMSDAHSVTSSVPLITGLRVKLHVAGEFNGDLYAYLRHVDSSHTNFCILLNRSGRAATVPFGYSDSGFDVTFDDAAPNGDVHLYRAVTNPPAGSPLTGVWQPDGRKIDPLVVTDASPRSPALTSFNGASGDGIWTLFIADVDSGATNMLVSWELEISGKSTPSITWPAPADIVYGTPLGSDQLNATSSVPGVFVYSPPAGTVLNAGSAQTLSVTFTPSDLGAYIPASTNVPVNVAKHPLQIAAVDTNKIYGASLPALAVSYSGFLNGDNQSGLSTPVALATIATATSPVGAYPITPSGASSSNYTISYLPGALTITPASLLISANSTNKVYGAAVPVLSASYSGFVNGDTASSLTIPVSISTTALSSSPTGVYSISASGASNANYTITYAPGSLSVTPAALTITANSTGKVYGASLPVFTAAYSGFVNGDTASSLSVPVSLTTLATSGSPVGNYPIVAAGALSGNYIISHVNGTLAITQAGSVASLGSSQNPALPGSSITFTCSVNTAPPGAGTVDGSVQFKVDGANAGSPVPVTAGTATYSTVLALGSHSVQADYLGSANITGSSATLSPAQLINTPPVASADLVERGSTNGTKVAIAALLANDSDSDGDPVAFVSCASISAKGATLVVSNGWIFYNPAPTLAENDTFDYSITDGRGTPVSGTVTVQFIASAGSASNLAVADLGGGSYKLHLDGVPNVRYRLQYTISLSTPSWIDLTSGFTDESGTFEYTDSSGAPQRYYRSVSP